MAVPPGAWAQTGIPSPAQPDQVPRRFETPAQPRATDKPVMDDQRQRPGAPPGAETMRFVLQGLAIDGVTVYTADDLAPLFRPLLGKEISLLQLYDLADAITAKYANDGYILSVALVPAQRIADGRARLQVIEGYVDRVLFDGPGAPHATALVRAMGAKIARARPLDSDTLERYLLLLGDLPGITARGVLRPSDAPGASDLVVVLDRKPMDAVASFDNRGTRFVGPFQASLGVSLNDTLGFNEQTSVRAIAATQWNELRSIGIAHDTSLGTEGTRGQISYQKSFVEPQFTLRDLRIESEQTSIGAGLNHPLIRTRGENLTLRSRFDIRNSLVEQDRGVTTLSEDRIRALRLGASYDRLDAELGLPGVSLLSAELSQGLNVLGARETGSATLSRASGRSQFTKGTLEAQRVQTLGDGFSLLLAANAQYSFSNLLASEEFFFGGAQYGRGFDPGEISGDHGVATKVELQWGETGRPGAVRDFQFYVFFDRGTVWRNAPPTGDKRRATGTSAGMGVRFNAFEHVSGNLELGKPIWGSVRALGHEDGKAPRLFFTLVGRY